MTVETDNYYDVTLRVKMTDSWNDKEELARVIRQQRSDLQTVKSKVASFLQKSGMKIDTLTVSGFEAKHHSCDMRVRE